MMPERGGTVSMDLEGLPPDVRAAVEAAMAGAAITITRAGEPVGWLEFRPSTVEGVVVDGPARPTPAPPIPDGVTVVATTMTLSDAARRRLSDELGSDYIVLDFTEAPTSADVLLTHPTSPQLLGILQQQFPHARVVVTEIEDEELGVHYSGPVSRLLEAGASVYLPPRPVAELAANVHAFLTQGGPPALEAARPATRLLEDRP